MIFKPRLDFGNISESWTNDSELRNANASE